MKPPGYKIECMFYVVLKKSLQGEGIGDAMVEGSGLQAKDSLEYSLKKD